MNTGPGQGARGPSSLPNWWPADPRHTSSTTSDVVSTSRVTHYLRTLLARVLYVPFIIRVVVLSSCNTMSNHRFSDFIPFRTCIRAPRPCDFQRNVFKPFNNMKINITSIDRLYCLRHFSRIFAAIYIRHITNSFFAIILFFVLYCVTRVYNEFVEFVLRVFSPRINRVFHSSHVLVERVSPMYGKNSFPR